MEERKLGHFRILAPLGRGGMGLVYKAEDERLRRPVALKVLLPECVRDAERRLRFLREARAAAAVSHPGIATIYEVGEDGDDVFIAMELVEGRTLRRLLEDGARPVAEAVQLAREIAQALERAHGSGVIHRDLKPENVMVDAFGHARILDFGLAKLRDEPVAPLSTSVSQAETVAREAVELQTVAGALVGTAAYMSPEQARGVRLDARSDLFSLGVMLYELVTGRNPFRGLTPADTLSAVIKDRARPAAESNPDVPPSLDRLLARLMAKEPAERPATAADLVRALEGVWTDSHPPPSAVAPQQRSIAVLPFADMSPLKDQDYFCEGLAEELISAFARISGLKVAARTSAFQFKGRADDVRQIGRQLGVETVLEGSVRKAGERLRVTAQLVSASDGYQLWSERYDRDLSDVFTIQDEIASTIVERLKLRLSAAEAPRVRHVPNVQAYNLYLQGRYWWNKRHQGGLSKATAFFEQAVELAPDYALAHSGVADAHSVIGFYGFDRPLSALARARQAAEHALELDESLPEAHVSLALIRFWYDWSWPEAEREFERALELDSHHANAHLFFGQLLAATGRGEEADAHWRAAFERDPLSTLVNGVVGSGLNFARRYEEARERCRQALALEPDHLQSLFAASLCSAHFGLHDEALDHARHASALAGRAPFFVGLEGLVCGLTSHEREARVLLAELRDRSEREVVLPYVLAWVHVGLGEAEQAIECLERAHAEKNTLCFALWAFKEFDMLRGHPRFDELLRRLQLPAFTR
jgi:serine/threonine protein kinase